MDLTADCGEPGENSEEEKKRSRWNILFAHNTATDAYMRPQAPRHIKAAGINTQKSSRVLRPHQPATNIVGVRNRKNHEGRGAVARAHPKRVSTTGSSRRRPSPGRGWCESTVATFVAKAFNAPCGLSMMEGTLGVAPQHTFRDVCRRAALTALPTSSEAFGQSVSSRLDDVRVTKKPEDGTPHHRSTRSSKASSIID